MLFVCLCVSVYVNTKTTTAHVALCVFTFWHFVFISIMVSKHVLDTRPASAAFDRVSLGTLEINYLMFNLFKSSEEMS